MSRAYGLAAFRRYFLILFGLLGLVSTEGFGKDRIHVAVAANFAVQMEALANAFEQETGFEVAVSRGSTGKLYAQILNGAPYDLFFAADAERPRLLEGQGRIVAGSRFTYLTGRLALWSREEGLDLEGAEILRADGRSRVAMANPRLAPYGRAAEESLRAMDLWESVRGRVVKGENVAQAFQFAATGNARFSFVAEILLNERTGGSLWRVPETLHEPILQEAALLKESEGGRAFLSWARKRLEK